MRYIHDLDDFVMDRPTAVTLGKFDGLHVGHQKLISIIQEKAKEQDLLSAVFTFDKIPLSICPERRYFISTNQERRQFLEQLGVDVEIEYPFTEQLMNTSPEMFIKRVLVDQLKAKVVVVGPDYRFGKDRGGNVELLVQMAKEYGYEAIVVEKERYQDREISSTYVREELSQGHMETANVLLGRPYSVEGSVCHGKQNGRKIETPTINIIPDQIKLLPPKGVYASTTIIDGKMYYGVTNVGTKPTVTDENIMGIETNLFDFNETVYGETVETKLMHFIRLEMKFDSLEQLKKQIESDIAFAKTMFMLQ